MPHEGTESILRWALRTEQRPCVGRLHKALAASRVALSLRLTTSDYTSSLNIKYLWTIGSEAYSDF
jgi:hypothetical protein